METHVVEEGVPLDVVVLQHLDEGLARLRREACKARRRAVGRCRGREGKELVEICRSGRHGGGSRDGWSRMSVEMKVVDVSVE